MIVFFYYIFIFSLANFFFINTGFLIAKAADFKKLICSLSFLIGYSLIILISSTFYLLFDFSVSKILFVLVLFNFIIFFYNLKFKKIFFLCFKESLKPKLFFIILFAIFIVINGNQYYAFRGNHWDYFNYLSSSLAISNFKISELISNENHLMTFYPFYKMGWLIHVDIRPSVNIFFSLFYKFFFKDFFLLNFVIKSFAYLIIYHAIYLFLRFRTSLNQPDFLIKSLAILLSLSFWTIYIFEIDSLSQLFAYPMFVFCFFQIFNFRENFLISNNIYNFYCFIISNLSFFLIYPELFSIYILFSTLFLLISSQLQFTKKILLKISFLISTFLILSVLFYNQYKFLFHQVNAGLENNNLWGYFGAFLLGKESIFLEPKLLNYIKSLVTDHNEYKFLAKEIYNSLINSGYNLFYLNILPSLSGAFSFTIGKINNFLGYLSLFVIIIINFYICYIVYNNTVSLLKYKTRLNSVFLSLFLTLIFLGLVLILNQAFWSLIKLYFYLSFFISIFFLFEINSKNYFEKFNFFFIILLVSFPLYFFVYDKNGIGNKDSFPSIIHRDMKTDFIWSIDNNKIKKCENILLDFSDHHKLKYITSQLYYNKKQYTTNEIEKKINCKIIINSKFEIVEYE